jgi:hypothetical protein
MGVVYIQYTTFGFRPHILSHMPLTGPVNSVGLIHDFFSCALHVSQLSGLSPRYLTLLVSCSVCVEGVGSAHSDPLNPPS